MAEDLVPRIDRAVQLASSLFGNVGRMIDLGCNDGRIASLLKDRIAAKEVYGVDIDDKAILAAKQLGVLASHLDLSKDSLPFPDGYFDLATSFEVMEHLINPDNMLREANRVLRKGGFLLVSTPNLASWVNRIFFLFGYQAYNVEVSTEIIVGAPYVNSVFGKPVGHIRALTLRALKQLLMYHGFQTVRTIGAPGVNPKNRFFRSLDRLFSLRCSLARRMIVLSIRS